MASTTTYKRRRFTAGLALELLPTLAAATYEASRSPRLQSSAIVIRYDPIADKIGFEKGKILGYTTIVLWALLWRGCEFRTQLSGSEHRPLASITRSSAHFSCSHGKFC